MKLYLAPTAALRTNRPNGGFNAASCPDDPTVSLVLSYDFADVASADAWENLPGVIPLEPEEHGLPFPATYVAAVRSWGAVAGMSRRAFLRVARRYWSPLLDLP